MTSEADHSNKAARVGPLLRQAHVAAAKKFALALQPYGIAGRHYGILRHLGEQGPMSQRRLIDLSGEDKSAMVRAVDDLERLDLAHRRPDPSDRRANAVELTQKGAVLLEETGRVAELLAENLLAGFSLEERETLFGLLQRFVAANAGRSSASGEKTHTISAGPQS